jgi:hypothetical protein
MADRPAYRDSASDTGGDAGVGPDRGSTTGAPAYPGTPRWVKAFGIVVLVLVLLVVAVMVAAGGEHGPSRHMPSGGGPGGQTPPAQVQRP